MNVSISSFIIDWFSDLCWLLEDIVFSFFLGKIVTYLWRSPTILWYLFNYLLGGGI